ncbi:hypothetical protein Y032_0049g1869 [Ancylostoma ceylanicum]|uniref:Domain of unknown function DB domain-containing protein n=1 Tax=Ancylostoma ceylanicum TaxID=53326 RepID=A0A016UAT6_9BILA|nr:hypothetical protein Y032_0049g1869 [Ancylostoma ceylanicum]
MIRFAPVAQLLVLYFSSVSACISLGCFGGIGGFGCGQCSPFGMCLSTPPCFGRYCNARARAAKTYRDETELVNTQDPNEHFLTCCGLLDVPLQCLQMCTFDGYNASSVQSVLGMTSSCPLTALPHVHFCAARGVDHTQCCRAAGVQQQCLMFCDQSPDTTNQLTLQHLGCLDGIDSMKDCFVEHALTEYYRTKQAALEHYQRIQIN